MTSELIHPPMPSGARERGGTHVNILGTSTDLSENRPYRFVMDPDCTDMDGTNMVLSSISVAILK